jgi:hypothetical protein
VRLLLSAALLAASLSLGVAAPATADQPTEMGPFVIIFDDLNPCTGLVHTVTIAITLFVHDHDGVIVERGDRMVSTSSGYSGRGTHSFVHNGQVAMFRLTDILTNDAGDRIRAKLVIIEDLSSSTLRVDRFDLTCLGA